MAEHDVANSALNRHRRRALVVFSCAYTMLYVGAFFGWGPMQLMLERNGSMSSRCDSTAQATHDEEVCPKQTAALINVQFIASTTQIVSPLLGQIADHFGAPSVVYCMTGCIISGLTILVLAVQYLLDPLLYVAFILLGIGTWFGGMLTIQTGLYFSETQHRIIVSLNSMFDSGAVVYLGLWALREVTGAKVSTILAAYLGLAVLLLGGASYVWTVAIPEPNASYRSSLAAIKTKESDRAIDIATEHEGVGVQVSQIEDPNVVNVDDEKLQLSNLEVSEIESSIASATQQKYIPVRDRTAIQQLTSMPAAMVAIFFAIHVTSNQWALTTTRDFLAYLGDDDYNNRYLTIFTLLTPASLLALPFVEIIVKRFGFSGGFQTVNALALAYNLVRLISNNLNVQIIGFVFFSVYRCFLFGVTISFLPTFLASNMNGKAAGFLYALTGLTSFINIPLTRVTIVKLEGNFFIPNLMYTLAILPCVVAAWYVTVRSCSLNLSVNSHPFTDILMIK